MGLTTQQWHEKRTSDIIKYVLEHGEKISATQTIWNTYPICVKDVCVTDILVKGKKLFFGYMRNKKFSSSRTPEDLERRHLEEIIEDMKTADTYHKKK